jgi:hypothetical protein
MANGTEFGFNLDEETVEIFDAILLALTQDPELKEEFTKLKFIQKLKDNYDGSKGPMRQIMEKLAALEKMNGSIMNEHMSAQRDMRRAVEDMTNATRQIRNAVLAQNATDKMRAVQKLEGMEIRQTHYSWNENKYGT